MSVLRSADSRYRKERFHTVALKNDGTVVAWGYNYYGQTTVPDGLTNVTAIAAGFYHTLALKSDGTVAAWGYNSNGQTTVPDGLTNVTTIAAGGYHSLALKADDTVVGWGYDGDGEIDIPVDLTGVMAIAAGGYHTVAILNAPPAIIQQPLSVTLVTDSTTTFNVTVIGSLPLSYQWSLNGTNVVGATNTSLMLTRVQFNQAGEYAVLVTNLYGLVLSSNAVLTVKLRRCSMSIWNAPTPSRLTWIGTRRDEHSGRDRRGNSWRSDSRHQRRLPDRRARGLWLVD